MPKETSTAPEVAGIKISIDTVSGGTPSGTPVSIGHVESVGSIIDKARAVKKYTPMNDTQNEEIVAMGSLTQSAFSMGVLYDPEETEGINLIEDAIDNNDEVQIILELNNALDATGAGTTIKQIVKIASFKVDGEKDGKYKADFSAEKLGSAEVSASTAGA